jgi:hypothetical protein
MLHSWLWQDKKASQKGVKVEVDTNKLTITTAVPK